MKHLALEVRLVDDVVVHDPEPPDSGRRQVERRGRAQSAGADEQHLRVEQPLLAAHADLGDQQVAAVAGLLGLVEPVRKLERQPGLAPGVDAAGERDDRAVALLAEGLGRAQRAVAVGAVEDDRALPVGLELLVELRHRNVHGVGDAAPFQLPRLADVDEDGRVVRGEQLVRPAVRRSPGQPHGHSPCSKDNRGRMSPRTRVFVVAGAAAALAAGGTVALAVVTGGDEGGAEEAQQAARPARRRSSSTSACASIRRRAHSGVPSASTRRSDAPQPDGSSPATTRRKPGSARRSRPGRTRAWRRSSAWPSSAGVTRSCSSTSGSRISGRVSSADATTAWREAAEAQPDSASAQRADDLLHPNFPPGQPFFVPTFGPPAGLGDLAPPAQLAALAREARRARRPRKASLRVGAAAARSPALRQAAVRRGREACTA